MSEKPTYEELEQRIRELESAATHAERLEHGPLESDRNWHNILVKSPQMVISLDPRAKIVFANAHFLALTGWREGEIIGADWFDLFIPEEIRGRVFELFSGAMTARDAAPYATYENEIVTRKGERLHVAWSNVVTRDEHGDVVDVTCFGMDLTERKRAEEEMRISAEQHRLLFENSSAGICYFDLEGNIVAFNPLAASRFNGKPEDFVGKSLMEIFPSEFAKMHKQRMDLAAESPGSLIYDDVTSSPKGLSWYVTHYTRIKNGKGETIGVQVISYDVTGRKHAEIELKKLAEAVQQAEQAIVLIGIDGNIEFANPAFEKITGYHPSEIIGRNPRFLRSGHQSDTIYEDLWRTILAGRRWAGQLVNRHKEGSLFTADCSISPVKDSDGQIINFLWMLRDITKDLELEKRIALVQRMEAIGTLAGGIAHDFNNMLSVISGHMDLALEEIEPSHSICADLEAAKGACKRSFELTRQLLAFARKQTIAPRMLDLNDTLEGMLKMLQRLIGEDIELNWIPGRDLRAVKFDPSQIDQILVNLCVNARDAITDGGRITIETRNADLDATRFDDHVEVSSDRCIRLSVRDNGCGMDAGTLENIFEPFFTTKGLGKGTGLGLSTVYGIVQQNNGFIDVHSKPGAGTVFEIYLPGCEAGAAETREGEVEKPVRQGRETILVVEDEPAILSITRRMLEKMGYTILAAGGPEEAVEIAEDYRRDIDLLLTDVVMPGMNGRDLAGKIRDLHSNIKTLFMSGYTADLIAHHGVLERDIHYIPKPFTRQALSVRVREVLDDTGSGLTTYRSPEI